MRRLARSGVVGLTWVAALLPFLSGAPQAGNRTLVAAPIARDAAAASAPAVSIVDPAGGTRVVRGAMVPLRVLVLTPKRVLSTTALDVRLRNITTGDETRPRLTPKVTVQVTTEDGGAWEHVLAGTVDTRKMTLGRYGFSVTANVGGVQVAAGSEIVIGIPVSVATLIQQRLAPDYAASLNDLVTFDDAHSWASSAVSLYVNPATGVGYAAGDSPGRENILQKVLGRPGWLPDSATDAARTAEIEKVMGAVSWRARYFAAPLALAKQATTDATTFTQAECAAHLEKEAPVLYQVAGRRAAVPQALVNGAGLSMGLQYPPGGSAVLSLVIQRGYWRLYDTPDVRQPVFPVDRAKLLVTARSAPPDLFDEKSDSTHARVALKPVPADWTPKASDWDWTTHAFALGTTPATTDDPRTTAFALPVKAVLSPRSTAARPLFRTAVAVQVRGDEPGQGWPPKEFELKQTPLLCGWYRIALAAGNGFPSAQVIYHQKFRDDPCAVPDGDDDGDGLPNAWECAKTDFPEGTLDLPALGANPRHKDLFLECDYMAKPGKNLQPRQESLDRVTEAFARAPVESPDGRAGITLHVDAGSRATNMPSGRQGNAIALVDDWGGNPFVSGVFDTAKSANFKTVRSHAFHYCIFANKYDPGESSGIARGIPSDDFAVTLGSWPSASDADMVQREAGTLMHEFGHTLGLRHGGLDDLNHKPNHLSIMNYSFQLTGLRRAGAVGFLDYSRFETLLDERRLVEAEGIQGPAALDPFGTTWSCPNGSLTSTTSLALAIDWNCDGDNADTVAQSINQDAAKSLLESPADWDSIVFIGGTIGVGGRVPADTSPSALREIGPPVERARDRERAPARDGVP